MYSDLHLKWTTLSTKDLGNAIVSGQYLDYIISGRSLLNHLGFDSNNIVTPFGWFLNNEQQIRVLKEFRLQAKTQLPGNRIELYICAACGDIGCGSITARISDSGDKIIWSDFADQSNDEEIGDLYENVSFEFERNNYFKAFSQVK